jgi:hypothetical protein
VVWFETQIEGTPSTLDKVHARQRVSVLQTGDARSQEKAGTNRLEYSLEDLAWRMRLALSHT